MKKYKSIIFFFLIISSVSAQEREKYFRRFYIDTRQYQLRTEIPISKEKAGYTYAYKVLYDDKDRIVDARYLVRGSQTYNGSGFTGLTILYSDSVEKRTFVNAKNQPVKEKGVYSYSLVLNSQRQPVKRINFDSKGVISEDENGIASYSWSLNEKGWIISEKYFDCNYIPVQHKKGFFEEKCYWGENADSYIIRYEYYNKDGNLTKKKDGVSINILRFDKKTESLQEIKNYNANNQLTESKEGYASSDFSYDKYGNRIQQRFLDKNNKLTENTSGIAIFEYRFDTLQNIAEKNCYGKKKELKPLGETGIARVVYKYDINGNPVENRFYDANGNLKENNKHEAIIRWTYDSPNCKLLSIKGYNAKDQWVSERYNFSTK
ncbi:MAG: hypothetical protein H6Q19_640 [Bacteroidetes bacterium]|nr:hypothetical protein [Bacteroidota bacterium]